jgi:hypothetical protein
MAAIGVKDPKAADQADRLWAIQMVHQLLALASERTIRFVPDEGDEAVYLQVKAHAARAGASGLMPVTWPQLRPAGRPRRRISTTTSPGAAGCWWMPWTPWRAYRWDVCLVPPLADVRPVGVWGAVRP